LVAPALVVADPVVPVAPVAPVVAVLPTVPVVADDVVLPTAPVVTVELPGFVVVAAEDVVPVESEFVSE
jgi:hypothetical protein